MKSRFKQSAVALVVSSLSAGAQAQHAAANSDDGQLSTVVVTAQKRSQNVQEVPLSVETLNAVGLEKAGVKDIFDLSKFSPSLTGGGEGRTSNARVGIRGISDFARNIGFDASVGVYVDGVFAGRQEALSQSMVGIERVEVLRGPQGTLFGKNTVAGAINITTRKPTEQREATLNADMGEFGYRNVGAWLGGAVVPGKFLASIALEKRLSDGYIKNALHHNTGGELDSNSVRLFGRFLASKELAIDIGLNKLKLEDTPILGSPIAPSSAVRFIPGPYYTATNTTGFESIDKSGGNLTVNYELPNSMKFTSVTAFHDSLAHSEHNDEDLTPLDGAETAFFDTRTRQYSQELRLASSSKREGDWLLGLFYMQQNNDANAQLRFGSEFAIASVRNSAVNLNSQLDSTSVAAFTHGNYRISENLQFTGGLRITREKKKVDFEQVADPGVARLNVFSVPRYRSAQADPDVSPKIGLNWFPAQHVMAYGSYSTAFKSGGFNTDIMTSRLTDPANQMKYLKQKVTTIEFGLKSELMQRRLRLNAAVFQTKGSDYQVQQFVVTPEGQTTVSVTNAGRVKIEGMELDAMAKLGPSLSLSANFAYSDAKFEEFKNGGGLGVHFDDHSLAFAPRLKGTVSADYSKMIGDYMLRAHVNAVHTGEQYSNPNNLAVNKIAASNLLGARFSVEGGERFPWTVSVWGKNLGNKLYIVNQNVSFLGVNRAIYGMPRTVGVSLSVEI